MIHVLKQSQFLPITMQEAWSFFSTPVNLNDITPEEMKFKIQTLLPEKIYAGLMILYQVEAFKNLPMEWLTEITFVKEPYYFVDEQRKGPYSIWHHEHHFALTVGGIIMTDVVYYQLPLGGFGDLFHGLLVKPKLDKIFNFRKNALVEKFKNNKI